MNHKLHSMPYYEQPVNELIRACLRLEYLMEETHQFLGRDCTWSCRIVMSGLIDIINVLDRPDLKTKLNQELNRYLYYLSRLQDAPNIDRNKVNTLIAEIQSILSQLQLTPGKLAQALRDNDFLMNIRQHLLSPGGGCSFDTPAYHFWLQLPRERRDEMLQSWLRELQPLHLAIQIILRLTRENSQGQELIAKEGFYQTALDPQKPCHLIRVQVPYGMNVFPEISVGRHRLCIRFHIPSYKERPTVSTEDIPFALWLCSL